MYLSANLKLIPETTVRVSNSQTNTKNSNWPLRQLFENKFLLIG